MSIRAAAIRPSGVATPNLSDARRIQEKTMKYMMLIYMNEQAMTDAERAQCFTESTKLAHDLHAKGQFAAASPLHPVATATSVRVRDGKPLVMDGPFAETREQ